MPATLMHRCTHCHAWFTPDRYNAWHQHYCGMPACRSASQAASRRHWLEENPDYFRGPEQCARVQAWRGAHPGYWRRCRRHASRTGPTACALQDLVPPELTPSEEVATCIGTPVSLPASPAAKLDCSSLAACAGALQDLALTQHLAVTALVLHLRGEPLQDLIGRQLERVYQCGEQRWAVPGARAPP